MSAESEPVTTQLFRHQPATTFETGATVFGEGDDADAVYIVKSGRIEIRRNGSRVATIGPGELFGEMSLVDDLARSGTAVAVEMAEVIVIPGERFDFMVSNTPGFALMVIRTLAHRLRLRSEAAT